MIKKIWDWIELILMILGFIYTMIVIVAAFILMLPILILFERTNKPSELEKANGPKNQASPQ